MLRCGQRWLHWERWFCRGVQRPSRRAISAPRRARLRLRKEAPTSPSARAPRPGPKRPNAQGQMREQDYLDELARQYAVAQKLVGAALTKKDRGRIRSAISRDLIAWRTHLTRAVPSIAGCRKSGWWTRARCRPRAGPGSGSSGFAPSRNGFSRGTPDEAWREPFRRLLKSKNAVPNFFRRALSEVR